MTTPVWVPGRLYNPGALVRASVIAPPVQTPPANADFESGDTGWTKGSGWSIGASHPFQGANAAQFNANTTSDLVNTTLADVFPGTLVDARCQVQQGASSAGHAGAWISIEWLDGSSTIISRDEGSHVTSGSGGEWKTSTVAARAPAGAAKARVVITGFRTGGSSPLWVDAVIWNATFSAPPEGLIFKAVQADAGFSGSAEPSWPTVLGVTVVDNQVTWEAVSTSRVVWEAHPIMKSGGSEPVFPTFIGATVADGTIIWEASSSAITDPKCPQTAVVLIAASKIFAVDGDVVRFSATVNPLDWSTANDAGYIPFGLNTYGSQPAAALGLYRSNLVIFNSEGFQMWQVDQDPANMALLDAVPAGCTYPLTPIPFSNDLPFLNSVGVRNIGIAGASTNLQADGVGAPIDKLVRPQVKSGAYTPFSITYPAAGQYWLVFGTVAFVLTVNGTNKKSWSRYVFPEVLTDWTLDGNDLVLRTSTHKVWRMNANTTSDDFALGGDPTFQVIMDSGEGYASWETGGDGDLIGDFTGITLTFFGDISDVSGTRFKIEASGSPAQDVFGFLTIPSLGKTYNSADATFEDLGGSVRWSWADQPAGLIPTDAYDVYVDTQAGAGQDFTGIIQWPHLDLGSIGNEKQFIGIDLTADAPAGVSVSIGYNQRDLAARTAPYDIDDDTSTGQIVPIPVSGPSFDCKLVFAANQIWEWQATTMYVKDLRKGS